MNCLFLLTSMIIFLTTSATNSPKEGLASQCLKAQDIELQDLAEDNDMSEAQTITHQPFEGDRYTAAYHSLEPITQYNNDSPLPHQSPSQSTSSPFNGLLSALKACFSSCFNATRP